MRGARRSSFARILAMHVPSQQKQRIPSLILIGQHWRLCAPRSRRRRWGKLRERRGASRCLSILTIFFIPSGVQAILEFCMAYLIEVMLVGFERVWTPPGHVAHQVFFAPLNISRLFCRFADETHFLCHEPVAKRVDVQINLEYVAEFVPVFFETVVIVGVPSARQEERISIIKCIKAMVTSVKGDSLGIHVGKQHPGSFRAPSNDLDAPPMASLAECPGFLLGSTLAPVSNGQSQDFSNTRS